MTELITWFKPHDRKHLKAYVHLRHTGIWPDGFLPQDMEIPYGWQMNLAHKIADEWVDEKLSHWEKGK